MPKRRSVGPRRTRHRLTITSPTCLAVSKTIFNAIITARVLEGADPNSPTHSELPEEYYQGVISEAIQKLRVSETALKLQLQAPSVDPTVAKALQKRLAQTERQRKALERKAAAGDGGEFNSGDGGCNMM